LWWWSEEVYPTISVGKTTERNPKKSLVSLGMGARTVKENQIGNP
jgi:hypothetical protein